MSKLSVHDDVPLAAVNVVPFKIQYTGDANTLQYFTPSKQVSVENGQRVVTADFRGLHLKGQEIPLGKKRGFVCTASEYLVQDEQGDVLARKQYTSVAKFDSLTVFGHDAVPPLSSKWRLIEEWDAIASAIHGKDSDK